MTIGERLRQVRIAKQMTLEEVAKIVKVSRQTIQRYESGIIGNIPSDKIELLALALDVTPAFIMGWKTNIDTETVLVFDADTSKLEQAINKSISESLAKVAGKILASKDEKKIQLTFELLEKIATMDNEQLEALSVLLRTIK